MNKSAPYSVCLVEDEFPARKLLIRFIEKHPELKLSGIAKNGKEAFRIISGHDNSDKSKPVYDLLLIDIQLPIISGLEVLEKLENIPYVIFITAYNQYASKAFEMGAIDYVVKPFENARFDQAINKFLTFTKYKVPYDIYRGIAELRGPEKYKSSTLTSQDLVECSKRLKLLMENDKVFLDPDINMQKLARKLAISPHHLSQVINQALSMNFYELVNTHRVEEAKNMLLDPLKKNKTIIDVLLEVGFNSKSVFNSVFKEYTGMTPTAYRRKMHKDEGVMQA